MIHDHFNPISLPPRRRVLVVEPGVVGRDEMVELGDAERRAAFGRHSGGRPLRTGPARPAVGTDQDRGRGAGCQSQEVAPTAGVVHQIFPRSRHLSKIGFIWASAAFIASSAVVSPRAAAANIFGTRNWLKISMQGALAGPGCPMFVDQ